MKGALSGLPLAFFLGIYYLNMIRSYGFDTLEGLLLLSYGFLEIESIIYVVPVIIWILPQIHLTYLLKDYISDSIETSGAYIFTRTKKKYRWMLGRVLELFCNVAMYYFVQFTFVALIGIIKGLSPSRGYIGLTIIFTEFVLVCLLNFFYVALINIGALRMKVTYSYFFTIFLNIFLILFAGFLYQFDASKIYLIKYLPPSQGILTWHSFGDIADKYQEAFRFTVQNFSPLFSAIYLIVASMILIVYGNFRLKNMDIY
ncbi:hypothetical protein Q2T46_02425 [Thermoanaerobacterium sp. CMT5567-10]|uniref:hypothetical protein n=1 Tax=Thermoanaerobacterium sp. CMT5567-10 TaxID=3061989 RepID=UPI0026E08A92|nr:hypothetical protein [Thermoanaerobacterium sp. CMT5567-10]WKV09332.1 hypothetical protein Q2T46_02425 [Thermoanaerobacterium sp. CMT5567-10]